MHIDIVKQNSMNIIDVLPPSVTLRVAHSYEPKQTPHTAFASCLSLFVYWNMVFMGCTCVKNKHRFERRYGA